MSCYEWERGTIKLSVKEYNRVKKAFIGELKAAQEKAYQNAVKLYDRILAEMKGKRSVDTYSIYSDVRDLKVANHDRWGPSYTEIDLDSEGIFYNTCLNKESHTKKPLKPKKKDYFPKIDRKRVGFSNGDFDISFNDDSKSVYWNVGENNHAKDHAHGHPVAKAIFSLLSGVKWTRGTGGTILSNDEYNQDSGDDYEGGGGSYVTMTFGGEKDKAKERRMMARSF